MPAIEINSSSVVCCRCGKSYGKRKGNFLVHYGALYKGLGYMPVCKDCVDTVYNTYLAQCNNSADAVRQVCRKFDIYWSQKAFDAVSIRNTHRTLMTSYIQRINTATFAGKCYDDTLSEEGTLWMFSRQDVVEPVVTEIPVDEFVDEEDDFNVSDEVIEFWGEGYDSRTYDALEKRKSYWMSQLPNNNPDIGAVAIIRQICPLELDINKYRAEGRDVDKLITSFDKLVNRLKSGQTQSDADADMADTPMGVWLYRYENKRPLPEIDDDLKDVNGILKYVFIWLGHVCKMLGKKNGFSRMYEAEIQRLRVEKPEFDDIEDDEDMMMEIFGEDEADGDVV